MLKNNNVKKYYFKTVDKVAQDATKDIIDFLKTKGFVVKDVQNDSKYQEDDVDLIAFKIESPKKLPVMYKIEIKADTYSNSSNYFMEYVSNDKKNTPGCILSTKSNYLFYYFVGKKELHIFDTKELQKWFVSNMDRFRTSKTSTTNQSGSEVWYNTLGKLVNQKVAQKELNISIRTLKEE